MTMPAGTKTVTWSIGLTGAIQTDVTLQFVADLTLTDEPAVAYDAAEVAALAVRDYFLTLYPAATAVGYRVDKIEQGGVTWNTTP